MYQATKPLKTRTSARFSHRSMKGFIGWLVRPAFYVRVAEVEQLQRAFKQMIDFFFTHVVRREQLSQIEIWETAVGHAGWQKFAQAAGVNQSHVANLFENRLVHGVFKHGGIQELTDLRARPALDQHRAKKAQRIFLKLESGI